MAVEKLISGAARLGGRLAGKAAQVAPGVMRPVQEFATKPEHGLGVLAKFSPSTRVMGKIFSGVDESLVGHGVRMISNTGTKAVQGLSRGLDTLNSFVGKKVRSFEADMRFVEKTLGQVTPADKIGAFHRMGKAAGDPAYRSTSEYLDWYNKLSPSHQVIAGKWESRMRKFFDEYLTLGKGKDVDGFNTGSVMHWAKGKAYENYVPSSISGSHIVITVKNAANLKGFKITPQDVMKGIVARQTTSRYGEAAKWIREQGLAGKAVIVSQGHLPSTIQQAMKNQKVASYMSDLINNVKITMPVWEENHLKRKIVDIMLNAGKPSKEGSLAAIKLRLGEEKYANLFKRGLTKNEVIKLYRKSYGSVKETREPFASSALQRRLSLAEREADGFRYTPEMFSHYAHTMAKKLFLQKPVRHWNKLLNHPSVANTRGAKEYMEGVRNSVLGVPGKSIEVIAQYTRQIGLDEKALIKTLATVMQAQAALKIGVNPLLPLVNATQIWINTGALLGPQWITRAYKFGQTGEGRKLIREAGFTWKVYGADIPKLYEGMQGMTGSAIMEKINNVVLFPFKATEMRHNRAYAYLAGFLKARKNGATIEEAKAFGLQIVDITQFPYGSATQPFIMGDPLVKTGMQFKTYMLNQVFFINELARQALRGVTTGHPEEAYPFLRMMAGYMILGGSSSIPAMKYFEDRSALLNEWEMKYPLLARGLPSLVGGDISNRIGLEFPTTIKDLLGPTYKDLWHGYRAAAELRRHGKFGEHGRRFVGGLSPGSKLIPGLRITRDKEGWKSVDYRGNLIARFSSSAEARAAQFGFRSEQEYKQSKLYQLQKIYDNRLSLYRRHHVSEVVKLLLAGRRSDAMAALRIANNPENGVVPGTPYKPDITMGQINFAFKKSGYVLSRRAGGSELHRRQLVDRLRGKSIMIE